MTTNNRTVKCSGCGDHYTMGRNTSVTCKSQRYSNKCNRYVNCHGYITLDNKGRYSYLDLKLSKQVC